jgi:transcriptional regulator with XRE-family HTH domain
MGWTESGMKSTKELIQAVKDVREHFGDTQKTFADRLGLSKRSIINYEKNVRPTSAVLARLARLASGADMGEQAITFTHELARDQEWRDIKVSAMSIDASGDNPHGWLHLYLEGKHAKAYGEWFYQTFLRYITGDPQTKAKAEKLLNNFTSEANKTWRSK